MAQQERLTASDFGQVSKRKTIFLFSDGTGNNSGRVQKTNVWRTYQTVDLGVPADANDEPQIGRYDNGVGNSSFKLLATAQGIFGWGLKRNILSLYLFLCRNYRPQDRICLFGFSRGAFTARVLADMIDKHGIISHSEGEVLPLLAADTYRAYRRRQRPRWPPMKYLLPLLRWAVERLRRGWRKLFRRKQYADALKLTDVAIDFVGVWDTVGAYGGPIQEFVRAVDDWITPVSFADRTLPACVKAARHALALDDERDSFQPLPWSERDEKGEPVPKERLSQIWFAGMHSDVGGGYPDDSLAYVSLVWMLGEARALYPKLRLRDERWRDAREQADAFGPIHNSRAGLAGYYRYQPRKIGALMSPPELTGRYLIDPETPKGQGMLTPVLVHDSVFRRVISGTDGYAPVAIPRRFEIVGDRPAEPKPGVEAAEPAAGDGGASPPILPPTVAGRLRDPEWQVGRARAQGKVWDRIWMRRILYFLIVLASLALAAMPELKALVSPPEAAATPGTLAAPAPAAENAPSACRSNPDLDEGATPTLLLRTPLLGLCDLAPRFAQPRLSVYVAHPWWMLLLVGLIFIFFKISAGIEGWLRIACRRNWDITQANVAAAPSWIEHLRANRVYQHGLGFVRWDFLPFLVGLFLLFLLFVALASIGGLARVTFNEQHDLFCDDVSWPARPGPLWLETSAPCAPSAIQVVAKRRYAVTLIVPAHAIWFDGAAQTSPEGIAANDLIPWVDPFFTFTRRVHNARWMAPLAITVDRGGGFPRPSTTRPMEPRGSEKVRLTDGNEAIAYRFDFEAPRDGQLAFTVNEAAPWPLPADFFYTGRWVGNRGGACILVRDSEKPEPVADCPQLARR